MRLGDVHDQWFDDNLAPALRAEGADDAAVAEERANFLQMNQPERQAFIRNWAAADAADRREEAREILDLPPLAAGNNDAQAGADNDEEQEREREQEEEEREAEQREQQQDSMNRQ